MRPGRWIAWGLLASCTEGLPSPSTVDSLRILALTTPTPELRPGERLEVGALWFDPQGRSDIRWRWRLCDPGPSDDPRACARRVGARELGGGDRVGVGPEALPLLPDQPDRTWIVYAIACPDADAVIDAGEDRLVCPAGVGSEAFRRVTVRRTSTLNRPPPIAGWTADAVDLSGTVSLGSLAPCDGDCPAVTLTLTPAPGAAEAFAGGAESLLASVYVTSGSVSPPRVVSEAGVVEAMVARWTPRRVVAGTEVARAWAVLRDQRGGESARAVTITAP